MYNIDIWFGISLGLFVGAFLSQFVPAPKFAVWVSGIGTISFILVKLLT